MTCIPSNHTTSQQRRCSDIVTTVLRHCVFAGLARYVNFSGTGTIFCGGSSVKIDFAFCWKGVYSEKDRICSRGSKFFPFRVYPFQNGLDIQKSKQEITKVIKWQKIYQVYLPSRHMTLIQRRLNVDATSWRCVDVESTLYKRHVSAGYCH